LILSVDIARRYLFGKKSTNAINLITGVSVLGLTIGTAALLLILSVFNGFEDLISKLFNSYNPDLKIVPYRGVYLDINSSEIPKIYKIKGVEAVSLSLEEVVLFEYNGSQEAGFIKGVDTAFTKVTNIDSTLIKGEFILKSSQLNYAAVGSGMFNKLSINPSDPLTPITVYAALKSKGPLAKEYNTMDIYPSGVFTTGSEEDAKYILTDIENVRSLIEKPNASNAIEIKISQYADEEKIRAELMSIFHNSVNIKNRYQQDEAFLKIMNIEKWISYLIACLTLGLISFNLIGALWMIVLDKKRDISVLKTMGFTNQNVKKLIIVLGILIGLIGLSLGLVLALVLYFFQKNYNLVSVPPGFLIDAYPISVRISDIFLVSLTVIVLSYLASIIPARRAGKISAYVRHE
jgi:lipoprotein-releasing system permease protein